MRLCLRLYLERMTVRKSASSMQQPCTARRTGCCRADGTTQQQQGRRRGEPAADRQLSPAVSSKEIVALWQACRLERPPSGRWGRR